MKKQVYFQQGDVLLIKTDTNPKKADSYMKYKSSRNRVLQHGEATGHAHRIQGPDTRVWESQFYNSRILEVKKQSMLSHEEHKTIILPKGFYEIRIVREFDHFQKVTRKVRD